MTAPRSPQESKSGSFIPLVLAFLLAGAVIATLSLLTMGFVGVIVAVVIGLAAFIALQYLIWGWWLGKVIREDDKSEREEERNY